MFYRKYIALIVLALYGVPAAIGPHWHSHHGCAGETVCASGCDGTHSHNDHASASDDSAVAEVAERTHECQFHSRHASSSGDGSSNTVGPKASNLAQQLAVSGLADDCGSCSICHFYACTPFIGFAVSILSSTSLVESLVVAHPEPQPAPHQLHLARGPPAALANA